LAEELAWVPVKETTLEVYSALELDSAKGLEKV
jgi:hypothetical protein